MAHLAPASWPPPLIRTKRLLLREPQSRDRAALIDLFTSAEVGRYIGGARPRDELERKLPEDNRRPGLFAVELDRRMIGIVTFDRLNDSQKGHVRAEGGEAALGYLFLPEVWGGATPRKRAVPHSTGSPGRFRVNHSSCPPKSPTRLLSA
jgi:RimJ/RimL family protein N-acetyltransferase